MAAFGRPSPFRRYAAGPRQRRCVARFGRAGAGQSIGPGGRRLCSRARPAAKANPAYAAIIKLGPEPAATYQITLSDGAWVDVVDNGELVKQSGYVRRRDCPGIDKSIRFKTNGGPLAIQISGAYAKTIKVEAARSE
jgi:hypothetical protein